MAGESGPCWGRLYADGAGYCGCRVHISVNRAGDKHRDGAGWACGGAGHVRKDDQCRYIIYACNRYIFWYGHGCRRVRVYLSGASHRHSDDEFWVWLWCRNDRHNYRRWGGAAAIVQVGLPVWQNKALSIDCLTSVTFAASGSSPAQSNWTGAPITVPGGTTIDGV